jgi:sec-independent protein translocase protein TatA
MGLGTGEIILIIFVVVIVFGASKLPQLGDGLGRALGSFKRALSSINEGEASPKKAERDGAAHAEAQESAKPADQAGPKGAG